MHEGMGKMRLVLPSASVVSPSRIVSNPNPSELNPNLNLVRVCRSSVNQSINNQSQCLSSRAASRLNRWGRTPVSAPSENG